MPRNDPLPKVALILAIWLAVALRVYHLDFQSIWWDEGHSIAMAAAPLSQIATLPGMDVHPPGYFWALHLWAGVFGSSEFALRFLSLVLSVLTIPLIARFVRDFLVGNRTTAWHASALAGLVAAIYPLSIAYAQEVRMYAMVIFLATLSTYALWRIVSARQISKHQARPWLWPGVYAVSTAAALYTHYFFIFLIAFQNLVWLLWVLFALPSGRNLRFRLAAWLGTQAAVLVLFAPQLRLALAQTTAYANPNLLPPTLAAYASRCWLAFSVGQTAFPSVLWMAGLLAVLSLLLVAALFIRRSRPQRVRTVFLLGWFLLPLVLYFLVLQVRPSFEPRYLAPISPALLLVWSWGVVQLVAQDGCFEPVAWRRGLAIATACVTLIALGTGTLSYFTNADTFKDDSRGVVTWLADHTTRQDMVYVDVPHPFHYYADRIPAPTQYFFVDVHTAAGKLNAEAVGRRRVFWVTWRGSDTDPRGIVPFLLDKAGTRLGEQDFRGYHITWWELTATTEFSLPEELAPSPTIFGGFLSLDGIAFNDTVEPGGNVFITCHFNLVSPSGSDLRASLRLRDAAGQILPPVDKDILNDRHFRTAAWPVDDPRLNQAINVYTLPISSETPPGSYRLEMVVYDAAGLDPLWVNDPTSPDGISAYLGQMQVLP